MEKGTKYWTSSWEASPYEKLETPLSEVFDTYSHDDREIIVLGAMEHKAILIEAYNESIIVDVDDIIDDIVIDDVVIDSGGGRGGDMEIALPPRLQPGKAPRCGGIALVHWKLTILKLTRGAMRHNHGGSMDFDNCHFGWLRDALKCQVMETDYSWIYQRNNNNRMGEAENEDADDEL
ncbi:hypothetical protein FXO38_33176 [Capsicum annuum]|nr:hypothetical protein FXO38_33176 [Capsicum annuum]